MLPQAKCQVPLKLFQRGPDQAYRTDTQWRALRRVNDLKRIYYYQFPHGLPENELGFKYAKYMCRTMAFDPIDRREEWLDRHAPWIDKNEILRLGPYWYSDRSLGEHLELSDAERERLQAWTIEASDVTPEQRKAINREKDLLRKEKKRRAKGIQPRQQWLAVNNKSRAKPWAVAGMSRRTWYRKVGTGSSEPTLYISSDDTNHLCQITSAASTATSEPSRPAVKPLQEGIVVSGGIRDRALRILLRQPERKAA